MTIYHRGKNISPTMTTYHRGKNINPAMSNPEPNSRRSIRLPGFDYSQPGDYFITIVTYNRLHLFGKIENAAVNLNECGQIARDQWFKTADLRPNIELHPDEFIVMPNHIHGIIHITEFAQPSPETPPQNRLRSPSVGSLAAVVRAYKSAVTYAINSQKQTRGLPVWQRNYYEHIIKSEKEIPQIQGYILNNPLNWLQDSENYLGEIMQMSKNK